MKLNITLLVFLISSLAVAQDAKKEAKVKAKALKNSKNLTWEGNKDLSEDNFVQAEANYRRAISKSNENAAAPFNLGNAYYKKETYSEAFGRFKQAGELATNKADKHKAYHNMANVFMKNKEYEKAVEGYKQALRNNPTDEETRYNLALAKELLKKQQDEQKKNDEKNKDKNKDQNKDQDKKDENKDGEKKEDDKGKEDENKDGEKDKEDKGDKGEEKNEKEKDGKGDDEKKKPNEGDKPKEQKQPRPNQLSKQQIKNLLQAMQNEEKKVQKKMDAKKVKGVKVKSEKDW